jgi:hypothetical protein
MPPWLQQLLTALGAFVGGRVVATVGRTHEGIQGAAAQR